MTKEEIIDILTRIGLIGAVREGIFDGLLKALDEPSQDISKIIEDIMTNQNDFEKELKELLDSYQKGIEKGKPNGYAPLDKNSMIESKYIYQSRKVVNGKITSTTPLSIDLGNVRMGFTWTNAGEVKCFIRSISGSVIADLRSSSLWGGSGVDSYSYDGATFTETPVIFDSVYYTKTSESTFWRIRENERVWQVEFLISGSGERCTIWADLIYSP